jgi:hypothetical protein
MDYDIMAIPGMGLSIICKECNGENRDLLGFYTEVTKMSLDELTLLVQDHEFEKHQMGRWDVP